MSSSGMIERAVINAGPLVALSLLEKLDVLPALFTEFWIPAPVYTEVVTAGLGRPGAMDGARRRSWLEIHPSDEPIRKWD